MKTLEQLTDFIEKEIDYDANRSFYCPECKHEELSYWIDHKSSLTSKIATFIGLKDKRWDDDGIGSLIYSAIEDLSCSVVGDPKKDAPLLARVILELF